MRAKRALRPSLVLAEMAMELGPRSARSDSGSRSILLRTSRWGFVLNLQLVEDFLDFGFLLVAGGARGVLDVEKDFGLLNLFEGGAEGRDQGVGKVADESDGIGEQDFAFRGERQGAQFWVESGEHARGLEDARVGEGVEEGAFPGVGVADEGHRRDGDGFTAMALLAANAADGFELAFEVQDFSLDFAAVGFELGFAGTPRADAAAELGHGAAFASEPGQHVFKLGELDLELAFPSAGVAGEDVEDELGAVDDAAGQGVFEVAKLGGREVVIDEDDGGVSGGGDSGDFFDFAAAEQGRGIGLGTTLGYFADDLGAGAEDEFAGTRPARPRRRGPGRREARKQRNRRRFQCRVRRERDCYRRPQKRRHGAPVERSGEGACGGTPSLLRPAGRVPPELGCCSSANPHPHRSLGW